MWHSLGDKHKFDLELLGSLLYQFLAKLGRQLVFDDLGQLFAPPDKGPCLITSDGLGFAATRDKTIDGIKPGRDFEGRTRLDMDGARCQAREEEAPNFLTSLDDKRAEEVHSCLLENMLPSL
jgi:hypothetical protein